MSSDEESDDDHRGIHRPRPDSQAYSVNSSSMRPIRPKEVEYDSAHPYAGQRY